ncbi:MAG: hypothetical protein Q9159_001207 [Coniocarpon cinnabarinum]
MARTTTTASTTPLRPAAASNTGPAGLPTPETSERQHLKRKRTEESNVDNVHQGPTGLLTPATQDDASSGSSDAHRTKRARIYPETPVIQSVEHDITPSRLPSSGATKPAAFHAEQLTPSAWRQDYNDRLAEVDEFRRQGWREADITLFRKISLRGFEPLLPPHWQVDFNNLPDSLFTETADDAFIKTLEATERQTNDFRATKSLWSVIDLGAQVRDDIMLGHEPQKRIARTFRHFLDWSLDDANLKGKRGVLPIAVVCDAPSYIPAENVQMTLNRKLEELANAWERNLKDGHKDQIPPLYGIAVSHSVWAIVSYKPGGKSQSSRAMNDPDNFSTLMNTFNYIKTGQEVWVAFAFAIFAIHCRDELIDVLDRGLVPDYNGEPVPEPEDPDE